MATTLKETAVEFPDLTTQSTNSIPAGIIIMWYGSIGSIPTGWVICDGNNDTPDLRDRFVISQSPTYSVGNTGGSADAVLVSHTHSGSTSSDNSHTHTISPVTHNHSTLTVNPSGNHSHGGSYTVSFGNAGAHTHTGSTTLSSVGGHNHAARTTDFPLGSHSHNVTLEFAGDHTHNGYDRAGISSRSIPAPGTSWWLPISYDWGPQYPTAAPGQSRPAFVGTGPTTTPHAHGLPTSGPGGSHSHTLSIGTHTHSHSFSNFTINPNGAHSHSISLTGTNPAGAHIHPSVTVSPSTIPLASNPNQNHVHTFTVDAVGESGTNKNLPPYYALAFIMKT